MVVACLALTVALAGTGYAVTALPPNSVGTTQLKQNAVVGSKVAPNSIRGSDIAEGSLGPLPQPAWRNVGAPGQPGFGGQFKNGDHSGGEAAGAPVAFFKDDMGVVHLRGVVEVTAFVCGYDAFVLPEGYRPANVLRFTATLNRSDGNYYEFATIPITITSTGGVRVTSCTVEVGDWIQLEQISFRAGE
jgi:hypothetical protein